MGWKVINNLSYAFGLGKPARATGSVPVHVFRGWKNASYSVAPVEDVLRVFGSRDALAEMFGGYVLFGSLFRADFVGVWGTRNASRFRRILREHLGPLQISHTPPPALGLGTRITGKRPSSAERRAIEGRL